MLYFFFFRDDKINKIILYFVRSFSNSNPLFFSKRVRDYRVLSFVGECWKFSKGILDSTGFFIEGTSDGIINSVKAKGNRPTRRVIL